MIDVALARKFIEQITQYTDYNINIMNDQGVIIASRDPKRVGTFHEVAYYIVRGIVPRTSALCWMNATF